MAVVSISRIQVRRGRKNQGSGLPQLASGEFGWAVDAQELFIGNGSVSEGAPYVGNTKILTEHDNVLEFSKGYEYRSNDSFIQTGSSLSAPTVRTVLERLDDRVSVRSFGAAGDGTNQAVELQRAINQLYLNVVTVGTTQSRVVLHLEAGEYVINSTIYLPPYTTIKGAGIDKTIIRMIGSGPAFQTVSSESTAETPVASSSTLSNSTQARNIEVSDITLNLDNNRGFDLVNCKDSIFKNIKITGTWLNADVYDPSTDGTYYGFIMTAKDGIVTCRDNLFENVTVSSVQYSVYSDYDVTSNVWKNCKFESNYIGFAFGTDLVLGAIGQQTGPTNNTINSCVFKNINQQAILITNGQYNRSIQNKFFEVGNNNTDEGNSQFAIIEYIAATNLTENDWFGRSEKLAYDQNYSNIPYIPEVISPSIYEENFTHVLQIGQIGVSPQQLFKLPGDRIKSYEIDYMYISSAVDAKRTGTLTIIADPVRNTVNIVDDYSYLGDATYSEQLEFTADDSISVDTVSVLVLNSTISDDAKLYYRVKTKA